MLLASRSCLVNLVRRSAVARVSAHDTSFVATCRALSSASGESRGGLVAELPSVKVTETKPGGGAGDPAQPQQEGSVKLDLCGEIEEEEEEEMEEMLQDGPAGKEWGGPTRGGILGEPTRFGDWERKGRCSDF